MRRFLTSLTALAFVVVATSAQVAPDALTRARQAYNAQQIADAVTLANSARTIPATRDQAAIVLGRALLERFRRVGDVTDLAVARQAVLEAAGHPPTRWTPAERTELTLAMAELLFADEHFGAAADLFEAVLNTTQGDDEGERVLEWWALSIDHYAQRGLEEERARRYGRLLSRVELELARRPTATALYWHAAAARGVEDLERAWTLVRAGWVRAPLLVSGDALTGVRRDLDRLMREAIIPERARTIAPAGGPAEAQAALLAEWAAFMAAWGGARLLP
jgi:hypothetical protein